MAAGENFLPDQYERTAEYLINHNYLLKQFVDCEPILDNIRKLVRTGDYTLGRAVDIFEQNITSLTGSKYCIGVGSGTDALFLSLKAIGVGEGDEVITTPYTFFATIGAIVTAGARPVFVDIRSDYNIDPGLLKSAITKKTKAILPVHWSGFTCEMDAIMALANQECIPVVEDACHAIRAYYKGKPAGTFGVTGCFSMHPLKNLNVWGDGGYVVTDSTAVYERLILLRNHGLKSRDHCEVFAYNSRLDTLQAIVANHLLPRIDDITARRIDNAKEYDRRLREIQEITIPDRRVDIVQVYHIYVIRAERRDELVTHLQRRSIDAKIHYPIPMHLQPAARGFGYNKGDFPVCESVCDSVLSLPVHEFITEVQVEQVTAAIKEFYAHG
jgi:dTDP-3-amino-2,3,6-trideoxy-4-keto-D-glucose/dTDP-3-amino-3,4,6-trideoxy-alpha-D-glucose/dTDP-2,6-dideoxy-D-kanosamine transaminase